MHFLGISAVTHWLLDARLLYYSLTLFIIIITKLWDVQKTNFFLEYLKLDIYKYIFEKTTFSLNYVHDINKKI